MGIAFQIYKVTTSICLAVFTRDDGSVDAFDEVMIALQPVVEKFAISKGTPFDHVPGGVLVGGRGTTDIEILRAESQQQGGD